MIKVVNPGGVSRMLEPVTNESLHQAGYEKYWSFEADSWSLGDSSIHDTAVWSWYSMTDIAPFVGQLGGLAGAVRQCAVR